MFSLKAEDKNWFIELLCFWMLERNFIYISRQIRKFIFKYLIKTLFNLTLKCIYVLISEHWIYVYIRIQKPYQDFISHINLIMEINTVRIIFGNIKKKLIHWTFRKDSSRLPPIIRNSWNFYTVKHHITKWFYLLNQSWLLRQGQVKVTTFSLNFKDNN